MQGFYGFSSFRLDVKKRRLMRGDEIVSLTPKEFAVLFYLIENAGRVVEKDELLDAVWENTFVEEGTLTRNISWLRKKLAENSESDEKFIETVPKRGYRFLPEVTESIESLPQVVENGENTFIFEEQIVRQIQIEEIIETNSPEIPEANLKHLNSAPKKRFSLIWIAPVLLLFAVLSFFAYRGIVAENRPKVRLAAKITPFSGLPGRETSPAFSPDGKQLVFAWDGGIDGGKMDIYIKLIGTGEPFQLTSTETDEINPVFSPDGKTIAFVRIFPTHNEIISIPALGGAERKIYEKASYASISFSPDGKFLAHAELDHPQNEAGIFLINLQTGEKKQITLPENPAVDHTPRFSPDGKNLTFIRYFSSFKREIFVVPATGGKPRQITEDDVRIYGLAWNADGKSLFFTSFRAVNQLNLWQISINKKAEPELIQTNGKNLQDLAISPDGKIAAFVEETADENIWEVAPDEPPKPLIRSSRADHSPHFSPDGTTIIFVSERTGNYEIWLADADGKNQRQLTYEKGSAGSPRFSPDGRFIAFDAQMAGGSDIFIVSVNGGTPRRLTQNGANNSLPAWSIDGKWVFFVSNRTGDQQIWKIPTIGGETVQITKRGAFEMFAAPDGKTIIYSKGDGKPGLWSVGTDGAAEKPIPELAEAGAWRSWSATPKGIYYTAFSAQIPLPVKFYDFANGQTQKIADVSKLPLDYYANLAVSDDGRRILYAQQDQINANIMFAELAE